MRILFPLTDNFKPPPPVAKNTGALISRNIERFNFFESCVIDALLTNYFSTFPPVQHFDASDESLLGNKGFALDKIEPTPINLVPLRKKPNTGTTATLNTHSRTTNTAKKPVARKVKNTKHNQLFPEGT